MIIATILSHEIGSMMILPIYVHGNYHDTGFRFVEELNYEEYLKWCQSKRDEGDFSGKLIPKSRAKNFYYYRVEAD